MISFRGKRFEILQNRAVPWGLLVFGMVVLIYRPMGWHLSIMPGTYGDTQLSSYILEHFYRWITGLDKSYWNTSFFYPFPLTLAYSDNLLGSAPFFALFRWIGLNRDTALQTWYMLGFALNYAAAAFVLARLKFSPLGAGLGAFFFAFGLPALAQEGHLQLLYRFCVPIAGYLLWKFAQAPRLATLAWLAIFTAWQFFTGIYIGVFLLFLLVVMALVMPWFLAPPPARNRLGFWIRQLQAAWRQAGGMERALALALIGLSGAGLVVLFRPYVLVTRMYGFSRNWAEVTTMLPRLQSYMVADYSQIWKPVSKLFGFGITMRNEHQLFPGLTVYGLILVSLFTRNASAARKLASIGLVCIVILFALTLYIGGFSFYKVIWMLPGMDSIRSVTRIILIFMWPLAILIASVVDSLPAVLKNRTAVLAVSGVILVALVAESASYSMWYLYSKAHAQDRLTQIRSQIPAVVPEGPILFLAVKKDEQWVVSEVDAMLISQDLGWATLNGYSGNFPPGEGQATSCIELPRRILNYMAFAHISDSAFYLQTIQRVVPIGFSDCNPDWWRNPPAISPAP